MTFTEEVEQHITQVSDALRLRLQQLDAQAATSDVRDAYFELRKLVATVVPLILAGEARYAAFLDKLDARLK